MKLCFSTLGCPGWLFGEIVSNAKDMGFSGIEVRGVGKEIYTPKIKEFVKLSKEDMDKKLKGIPIVILTSAAYLHLDESYISEAKEYIDTAKKFGIPFIRVLGDTNGNPGDNVDAEKTGKRLKILDEYAEGTGVTVLLETNGVFASSTYLKEFLEKWNFKNVAVLWDIHHPYVYFNEQPQFTYSNLKKYIRHIHIKDSVITDGKVVYKMLGAGSLPIADFIKLLKEDGFDGYLSLEWLKRWNRELEDGGVVFAQYKYYMDDLLKGLE